MVGMTHTMSDMSHEMVMSTQTEDLNHVSDCCNTMEHCVSGSCSLPAFGHVLSLTPILATTAAVGASAYSSVIPARFVDLLVELTTDALARHDELCVIECGG